MIQTEFLLFDSSSYDRLISTVDQCLTHTQLVFDTLHTSLHVKVPTKHPQSEQIMTIVRRVSAAPGIAAENEIRNAARIMAREVKALVEFKDEIAIVSYMDDEGIPVAVGEQHYLIDRNRLKIPEAQEYEDYGYILNCVEDK